MTKRFSTSILFLAAFAGCDSAQHAESRRPSPTIATESEMHALASKECLVQVLKNIDHPFDAKPEAGSIWIDPEDPVLAQCVMYCTHSIASRDTRSLFLVTFDNSAYPAFASSLKDLRCVLVNRDGKVVYRDEDYWHGDSHAELLEAGAADSEGPPYIATGLLEMAELRKKYSEP